jgi:hypothetical protein
MVYSFLRDYYAHTIPHSGEKCDGFSNLPHLAAPHVCMGGPDFMCSRASRREFIINPPADTGLISLNHGSTYNAALPGAPVEYTGIDKSFFSHIRKEKTLYAAQRERHV